MIWDANGTPKLVAVIVITPELGALSVRSVFRSVSASTCVLIFVRTSSSESPPETV